LNTSAKTLVVLSPNWLGDAVMALPALADVRRHFAGARLTVAARASVAALYSLVRGVDEVLTLPGRGGLAALTSWKQDVSALGSRGFDTALLFPNSFASALIVSRAGIPERWGLATDGRRRLLTRAAPKPRGYAHQADYYQALVAAFGIENGPLHARVEVPVLDASPAPSGPYVVLAPGAAYGKAKQWPPERFAQVAARLAGERDWKVALVGSRADAAVCASIARMASTSFGARPSAVVDLSGRTSLAELVAVLAGARAVVSNDSGAMHLASAAGVPVVAIFGATNEHRTSPLTRGPGAPAARILTSEAWCRPCMLRECPIDHRCMTGVSAGEVLAAIGE
jgi:heptosyltransferase-2